MCIRDRTSQQQLLAAPVAEPKFRLPAPEATISRPALTVASGPAEILLPGTSKPLAAPRAESKFNVADAAPTSVARPNATTATSTMNVPLAGPAQPLAAPRAESK